MSTPPVPAQRKVKLVASLKTILSEQSAKLQTKHQLENDLLEDIRSYTKLRAAAEKEFAQALLKITSQMLSKFQTKDDKKDEEARTPYGLWRQILEDTESMANARMAISQTLQTNVVDSIKNLKTERTVTVKKCTALAEKLHEELQVSAAELAKNQKTYGDLQKITKQAIDSVTEAQEKLNKGTIGLFSSKAKMEKNLSKANERREVAEKRSTTARNEYLLSLAAMNGHQQKYYSVDLPDLIAVQDGSIYGDFKRYYSILTSTERETCQQCVENLKRLEANISQLERAFAIQFFLKENSVFTKCTPHEFTPLFSDKVTKISEEFGAGLLLNKEARKWTLRLAREQKNIHKKTKELNALQAKPNVDTNVTMDAPSDGTKTAEQTIEDLVEEIRHLEVMRTKSEARIEALRSAGVDVDTWLQGALAEQENEDEGQTTKKANGNSDYNDIDDDFGEDEWDEPSPRTCPGSDDALSTTSSIDTRSQATLAIVIYPFQATSSEELTVMNGEEIDFLEREGDGWCKTRNKAGQVGYVPEAYIEIRARKENTTSNQKNDEVTLTPLTTTYSINNDDKGVTSTPLAATEPTAEVIITSANDDNLEIMCFAKAAYDYDACGEEELSFKEGDIIMVVNKMVDDDDGWWEGILNGTRGVFPSIVVEETQPPEDAQDYPPATKQRSLTTDQYATFPRGPKAQEQRKSNSLDLFSYNA